MADATYVQRRRTRGWRAPTFAVPCTRTRGESGWVPWGNPFRVGDPVDGGGTVRSPAHAVVLYRKFLRGSPEKVAAAVRQLSGRPLMCWCRPGASCHVQDVLIPLVNEGRSP